MDSGCPRQGSRTKDTVCTNKVGIKICLVTGPKKETTVVRGHIRHKVVIVGIM